MHLLSRISKKALSPKFDARSVPVVLQSDKIQAVLDPTHGKKKSKKRYKNGDTLVFVLLTQLSIGR